MDNRVYFNEEFSDQKYLETKTAENVVKKR